jgi:hypothetical protein
MHFYADFTANQKDGTTTASSSMEVDVEDLLLNDDDL